MFGASPPNCREDSFRIGQRQHQIRGAARTSPGETALFPNAPSRHGSTRAVPPLRSQELAADPALRTGRADAQATARRQPVRQIEPSFTNDLRTEFERVHKRRDHLATLGQFRARRGGAFRRETRGGGRLGRAAGQRIGTPTGDEVGKKIRTIRNWTVGAHRNPTARFGATRRSMAGSTTTRLPAVPGTLG